MNVVNVPFDVFWRLETSLAIMASMWMCMRLHMPTDGLVSDLRLREDIRLAYLYSCLWWKVRRHPMNVHESPNKSLEGNDEIEE